MRTSFINNFGQIIFLAHVKTILLVHTFEERLLADFIQSVIEIEFDGVKVHRSCNSNFFYQKILI